MIDLYDILEAANGQLFGEPASQIFTDFCFDSRRAEPGQIFVAVKTNQGDGHDYMEDAVQRGVTGIMCTNPPTFDTEGLTVVVMRDVERALVRWTERILRKFGTSVIGVTGSNGKSTTKEAIARVLGTHYNVYKSPASYNGRFGLPLALGKLSADYQLAVLEFGIDQFGEMTEMVEATHPVMGVVTNIGHTHLDRLGTIENIAHEKQHLVTSLPEDGIAILNYDDLLVRKMQPHIRASKMTVGVDMTGDAFGADLMAYNIIVGRDKTGFDLRFGSQRFIGKWIPLLGAHQLYGALMAISVGLCFDIAIGDSLRALTEWEPLPGRMRPLTGANGSQIIDDSHSANPESTLRALEWLEAVRNPRDVGLGQSASLPLPPEALAETPRGRVYLIMGDMAGLGDYTSRGHRDVGKKAASVVDRLVTKGEMATEVALAAEENGLARTQIDIAFSAGDAVQAVIKELGPDDIVLVKGSPPARMERVVRALLESAEDRELLPRTEAAFESVWMDRPARPTWLHIDMDAVANNVRHIKTIIGDNVALMAVVKANAYGHGAVAVSTTALLNGATYLGVASINEAIELRDAGIKAPILILGYTPAWAIGLAIRYNIAVTLYDLEIARAMERTAHEMNARVRVHVKIDTGMGRLGILPEDTTLFFRTLAKMQHIEIEGIFTHFSVADEDHAYTEFQVATFEQVVEPLAAAGFHFKYIHAANSAGALGYESARFNMVRAGIAIHGLAPGPAAPLPEGFIPTMTWKTTIAQVKRLPAGSYVGYGNTYRTRGAEKIAVIPVGYADGFRRSPQNWGYVLVNGQRAALVGRVSMDQTMINVTDIDDVKIGDEVVLIGSQGKEMITVEAVAERLGTVNYELVSTILARVPRVK
ncbi:MAG: alanine racemase [Chloroflexi bacterium]|nr:alanine racemase [Chloroflexota bacterium]